MWDEKFEKALRAALRFLGDGDPIDPDVSLTKLGLDSMETVGLVVSIESQYGVTFPDETLTADTFASARALWAVVGKLADERPAAGE